MKILITGSQGFVGKNLQASLWNRDDLEVLTFTRDDSLMKLEEYCKTCDLVFHLAGVNRPQNKNEFKLGNRDFTDQLLSLLRKHQNPAPVVFSSSTQASLNNEYGFSKKAAEDLILKHQEIMDNEVFIYRLPNLFGKWAKPFYNSVIATWSHQISRGEAIKISDPDQVLRLVYIDDLINDFLMIINGNIYRTKEHYYQVSTEHRASLGQIAKILESFYQSRKNRFIPKMDDALTRKLYATYLNYLAPDNFSYPLEMHKDERGSFTEFVKSFESGQVSVNVSKPKVSKGGHWHHSKNEKFLVVSGQAIIQFRDVFSDRVIEYQVSDKKLEVVDIPTGYTHSIINSSTTDDLVTIMWVNEPFDPKKPDTYALEVKL